MSEEEEDLFKQYEALESKIDFLKKLVKQMEEKMSKWQKEKEEIEKKFNSEYYKNNPNAIELESKLAFLKNLKT